MAVENDEIDVPEEVKNSLEVTPKLAEAFPEAITLSEALNCRICRSHIKTPMLTKCKTLALLDWKPFQSCSRFNFKFIFHFRRSQLLLFMHPDPSC